MTPTIQRAIANGLIRLPPTPRTRVSPRHKPRRRRANLGTISVNGQTWVVEFRPPHLVIRKFYSARLTKLSLQDLVDIATGQSRLKP